MSDEKLSFIVSLSTKHGDEIGFIPRPKLEKYAAAGQVDVEYENGELCGFLVWGNGWPILRIYQACIQYDAQKRKHGYALVGRLIVYADANGYESICLWCAEDLEANEFWKSCGFENRAIRDGGGRRKRNHRLWTMTLSRPQQIQLQMERPALDKEQP